MPVENFDPDPAGGKYWRNNLTSATLALKAKVAVELGFGWSAEAFLCALEVTNGRLYSVDLHHDRELLERYKAKWLDRFNFIQGDSVEAGKKWDKGDIDILLCDSDHSYEHVTAELNTWGKHNPKIIFIHDTLWGGVSLVGDLAPPYEAAKQFAEQNGKKLFNFTMVNGLGVIF